MAGGGEGGLQAPVRHPLGQDEPAFWDQESLDRELARVYDICHGCRRCVSLCDAFPVLFDLVDESASMEVDGVDPADYGRVVDQCYLCDMCYMSKCPYVPPHEWNVDFPHLMLRAKAVRFRKDRGRLRDRLITSTDMVGGAAAAPLVNGLVNLGARSGTARRLLDRLFGIHRKAWLPSYASKPARRRHAARRFDPDGAAGGAERPRVTLFATCYCNYNEPDVVDSLIRVLEHNEVDVFLAGRESCCGMPKLELGDLDAVRRLMERNVPALRESARAGHAIIAAVPSCVLMFKQELPLMFPDDEGVAAVAAAFRDPFEYLHGLHREGRLKTDFRRGLGTVSYHAACHQRVQNIGPKTRQVLELIEGTEVHPVERCSGHDGTYGVKTETFDAAARIVRPVARRVAEREPDHYGSDCPVAGRHIERNLDGDKKAAHPIDLLRMAYGI